MHHFCITAVWRQAAGVGSEFQAAGGAVGGGAEGTACRGDEKGGGEAESTGMYWTEPVWTSVNWFHVKMCFFSYLGSRSTENEVNRGTKLLRWEGNKTKGVSVY